LSPDCHILVAEDEFLVAVELIAILTHEGAIVLGPAQTVQQALGLVARNSLDCALVDIRLADGPSFAVADRLAEHGVPFAFVTAYAVSDLPPRHRKRPVIYKPFTHASLLTTVRGLVEK
jgi:DNA-binding LytR/AlgR family response regulator